MRVTVLILLSVTHIRGYNDQTKSYFWTNSLSEARRISVAELVPEFYSTEILRYAFTKSHLLLMMRELCFTDNRNINPCQVHSNFVFAYQIFYVQLLIAKPSLVSHKLKTNFVAINANFGCCILQK